MFSITELTCRVCLQEQQVVINVFEVLDDLHTTLSNLLETCGDLHVDGNDDFPKYLCEECTAELLAAAKFREKCANSKKTLASLQINNNDEINKESSKDLHSTIQYSAEVDCGTACDVKEDKPVTEASVYQETQTMYLQEIDQSCEENQSAEENVICDTTEEDIIVDKPSETFVDESENDIDEDPASIIDYEPEDSEEYFQKEEVHADVSYSELTHSSLPRVRKKKSYKCDICGAAFVQAINLQKHLQKNHKPVQFHICQICDHWFTLGIELMKHEKYCTQPTVDVDDKKKRKSTANINGEKSKKCVYCYRDFQTPFALRMHLRTHTGERPYACQHCDKAFKTQSSLNVHTKRHTGQADFICTVCGKSFYEQGNLDVHMRSHTGERPYICAVCQKSFTRVFLLELHMRSHTGEKPFTCSYCDRSFRQRTEWKSHLSSHTGIKQYNCHLCAKGYVKRMSLVQHMKSQHAMQMDSGDRYNDVVDDKNEIFNALDYITENEDSS